MTAPSAECFLVQLSKFTARNIDITTYLPPYFLRGSCCLSTFFSDACLEESSPSWSVCHRFEYDGSEDSTALQMALKCYSGGDGDKFVGMTSVQLQDLLTAVAGDSVAVLPLRDGSRAKGEISFHVELDKLLSLTLHAARVALVPRPPQETSLYVELSCSGVGGLVRVQSEQSPQGSAVWTTLPLLHCRTTLASLVRDGVAGALFTGAGEQYACFQIIVTDVSVAPLKTGTTSCHFPFSASVKSAGQRDAAQRCVGDMTVSTNLSVASKFIPAAVFSTSISSNDGVAPPRDLQVMEAVLQRQHETLARIQDQLAGVRKIKDDVRWQLELLRRRGTGDGSNDSTIAIRCSIEEELQVCMRHQKRLKGKLASIQKRKGSAAREHAAREGKRMQQQRALMDEYSELSQTVERVRKLQGEMQEHAVSEEQRQLERLRVAMEQQQLSRADAETLDRVEQRLQLQ